jgi:hypothetical protein
LEKERSNRPVFNRKRLRVRSAEVTGHGLWVSPDNRRSFTTGAKIADTFLLANVMMNDIVTPDDTEKPPPCPWCNVSAVKETTDSDASSDTRWFHCESCKRVFSVHFEPLKPPEKN